MKRFELTDEERHTLLEMSVWHPHPRARRRAQGLLRLAQQYTQEQVAHEFGVHRNSVRGWKRHWQESGLVGLYEGAREGRPTALSPVVAERLRQVALEEGGTVGHIMHCMEQQHMPLRVQPATVAHWLKDMGLSYKRYRASLKKSAIAKRWRASGSSSKG